MLATSPKRRLRRTCNMLKTPRRRGAEDDDAPPTAKRAPPRTPSGPRSCRPTSGSGAWTSPTARRRPASTRWRRSRPPPRSRRCRAARSARWRTRGSGRTSRGARSAAAATRSSWRPTSEAGAQNGRPWRVLGRALRDFLKKCTHCRAVEAPIRVPFGVRLCNACATIRPGGALIREGPRARRLPPRRRGSKGAAVPRHAEGDQAPPPVPDFTEAPPVTQSPALVFSPRSGEVALDVAPPVEERVFGGAPFLSPPPPHS